MDPSFSIPSFAAWQHVAARQGFEVVFLRELADGLRVEGHTTAVEDGRGFAVGYAIEVDASWRTRWARVDARSRGGERTVEVVADEPGRWRVGGTRAAHLDGCLDVDLAASVVTNAFPVHRLALGPGEASDAPAAFVSEIDLEVTRLEQHYRRLDDGHGAARYDYQAPAFDVRCELAYDRAGLVTDYPGMARRVEPATAD